MFRLEQHRWHVWHLDLGSVRGWRERHGPAAADVHDDEGAAAPEEEEREEKKDVPHDRGRKHGAAATCTRKYMWERERGEDGGRERSGAWLCRV